jgi:CRP-like cAMP-binding protein
VLEALAAAAEDVTVPAGTAVVRQGGAPDFFYVVDRGSLEVTVSAYPGDPGLSAAKLGPGDYFGEIGLLRGVPRTASVTTLEQSRLYRISGQSFVDAVNASPGGSPALAEGVATRMARTAALSDIEAG